MGSWYRYEPLEDSILSTRWHACCLLIARRESKHMLAKILDGARRKNASYQVRSGRVTAHRAHHVAAPRRKSRSIASFAPSRDDVASVEEPRVASAFIVASLFFFFVSPLLLPRHIHPRPSRT
jgi:hypothetical protein